ncbi:MAG: leucine-rich repeat protein [Spirochaetaceae bacterium]|jgi:hypothetical protein|nr:leucine-rich repeat protein [Spirochaetaceae bacterium]
MKKKGFFAAGLLVLGLIFAACGSTGGGVPQKDSAQEWAEQQAKAEAEKQAREEALRKAGEEWRAEQQANGEKWQAEQQAKEEAARKAAEREAALAAAANAKGVSAEDFEYDINLRGDGILLKKYKGNATIVNIPGVIEGFPVKEIADTCFSSSEIVSVTIPDTVTSDLDFTSCSNLTSVTLPKNYAKCPVLKGSKITAFDIPAGTKTISDFAFMDCRELQRLTIPASVTSIGDFAFQSSGLTSIDLPPALTRIGKCAFRFSKIENITIPDSVTVIGLAAFEESKNLISVTLPRNLQNLGGLWREGPTFDGQWGHHFESDRLTGVFKNCTNLKTVVFRGGCKVIGITAFSGCTSLASVTINGPVEYLGNLAFDGCAALTEIVINGNISRMGCYISQSGTIAEPGRTWYEEVETDGDSFKGCSGLTTVTVGPNVTKIGNVDSLLKTGKLTIASRAALNKVR